MQRDSHVNDVHGHLRRDKSDGAAAALIYLTQLSHLEYNALIIKQLAQRGDKLRGCVIRASFALGSGIFKESRSIAKKRRIVFLADRREIGIERCGNIRRQHFLTRPWRGAISAQNNLRTAP